MGIFAILVAVGVPTMRTWISNVKVRAVADGLQNGVRLAQSEALRRSRQVVFSRTNSTTPQTNTTANAGALSLNWQINTIPSLTGEAGTFVDSGVMATVGSGVVIAGPAEICFNSVGRLVANNNTGVLGATCVLPATTPPVVPYLVSMPGLADHPLQVQVGLGGQVHLCDPSKVLSSANPDGC